MAQLLLYIIIKMQTYLTIRRLGAAIMKKYIKIALITILIFLTLNTYAFAKTALQNYAGQTVAEAAETTADLNKGAGGIFESASLLLLGAGMLIIAIYIRKRWMKKEG